MEDRRALYVRLPAPLAMELDRAAFERKVSKQALVTDAVRRITIEGPGEPMTLGHAEVRTNPPADVLTPEALAELLQVAEDDVRELAERGELPGRKVAGEWRFAREAVLRWLAGE
jgi:excisionase family DNA binding protein